MHRGNRQGRRSGCPLNVAVEVFGDHWSLLIIRDLMFKGAHSFNDLMDGGEGIATNILAQRLEHLATQGIVIKARMATDRRRYNYLLTEKGINLAPVLVEMVIWGARYEKTDAPAAEIQELKDRRDDSLARIRKQWEQDREGLAVGNVG